MLLAPPCLASTETLPTISDMDDRATMPAATASTEQSSPTALISRYELEGVLLGEETPLAVINGAMVGVGQHVGDAEVIRIDRTHVRLRVGNVSFDVSLRTDRQPADDR